MIDVQNWDDIQERQDGEYPTPEPGGYIAKITGYEDVEAKQYLRIFWDFAEGEFVGLNQQTYDRAGFHPYAFIRSYKPTALGFFKGFKTVLEVSNPQYRFNTRQLDAMVGKYLGVVLAKEEYRANSGEIKLRLYVAQVRSVKAIREQDFKVPDLRKAKVTVQPAAPSYGGGYPPPAYGYGNSATTPYIPQPYVQEQTGAGDFYPLPDDGDLPF
jgi:hypothetical protein